MILDNIANLRRYKGVNENFDKAFDYIEKTDIAALEAGKHEISGSDVFILIQEYTTHPAEGRFMEAHRKFADIQIVLSGKESIYYSSSPQGMKLHQEYDDSRDCVLYSSEDCAGHCRMKEGDFAIFYPEELHQPCCELNGTSEVKKAVVKVKMD